MAQLPQVSSTSRNELTSSAGAGEGCYWKYFGAIVVTAFLMRLACFSGLIGSDDLDYSRYAQLIAQFNYKPEMSQFAIRYGLIVPLGVVYNIFGISEWTTILLPLLASTASVALVMLIGQKLLDARAALLAGFLLATFPADLRYATILIPEPVAGVCILAAIFAYISWGSAKPAWAGLVSGLCIGAAYLAKEPALFVAPALMIDALLRRQWRMLAGIAGGVLAMVGMEHIYYLAATGDLMFRPHAMAQHNQTSYMFEVNRHLWGRLFKAYPEIMIWPTQIFGLHSLFAIVLAILGLFLLRTEKWRLLLLWTAVPFLYLNFGTSSLIRYWALPVDARYLLFIYPPLFLLAAQTLVRLNSFRPGAVRFLRITFLVVVVSGFCCGFADRGRGWRTDAVKELRTIAQAAKSKNVRTLAIEGADSQIWWRTLTILNPNLRLANESETADTVIRPDAFGLPSVASVPAH